MTESELRRIWHKTQGHCHFCGDPVVFEKRGWKQEDLTGYWEVDHVIQRDKGGSVRTDNRLPACTRCNRLRWHRKGEAIRELLFLGLIARDEIRQGTTLGRVLGTLRERRLTQNKLRRRNSAESLQPPNSLELTAHL
jgi:5-methylcytosine-specific restriction endonuclease McrA